VKLLFDHHLSPALATHLGDLFPGSDHVWNLDLHEAPDVTIWMYAREHAFTVVSKDADFSEISMQLGFPPKLVWLRIGNCTTRDVEELLRSRYPMIAELHASRDRGILALFRKPR